MLALMHIYGEWQTRTHTLSLTNLQNFVYLSQRAVAKTSIKTFSIPTELLQGKDDYYKLCCSLNSL